MHLLQADTQEIPTTAQPLPPNGESFGLNAEARVVFPIESAASVGFPGWLRLCFGNDRELINNMAAERVGGNGSSHLQVLAKEVEKEAVFTEHLPLCKTELFHELPVIVVGHKNNAPEFSNPLGPLGPIMGKTKRISRSVFAINQTLLLLADLKKTPSYLAFRK